MSHSMLDVLALLDRETTRASNAPDMRRVMSTMACELRAAGQRRVERGEVVRYDGVGEVELGGTSSAETRVNVSRKLDEAVRTLRLWGVEVQS